MGTIAASGSNAYVVNPNPSHVANLSPSDSIVEITPPSTPPLANNARVINVRPRNAFEQNDNSITSQKTNDVATQQLQKHKINSWCSLLTLAIANVVIIGISICVGRAFDRSEETMSKAANVGFSIVTLLNLGLFFSACRKINI
jgi:hypothetical protein